MISNYSILRDIPLFAGLNEEDLVELAKLLQTRTFATHEPVFWIGEPGADMYIIQQGEVRMSYPDDKGNEVTLAVLGPGMFFGELSLLDGGPRTATARTYKNTTLFVLDGKSFFQFLQQNPAAVRPLFSTIATRQREGISKLRGIVNVNLQVEENLTPLQKLVDKATRIGASVKFLTGTLVFIIGWMVSHTYFIWRNNPDKIQLLDSPPTFFWLGYMITLTSFLLTIFVLNSQRRQALRDRIRADIEYQVNLKAHAEVMSLHQKIDALHSMLHK